MSKKISIKVFLVIGAIILAIIGFKVIYYINLVTYNPIFGTKMYRVYDTGNYETRDAYTDNEGIYHKKELVYYESYIVVNSPENAQDLEIAVKAFERQEPIDHDVYSKTDRYKRQYIKESKEMTRKWKPTFMDGREENHYSNIIATTTRIKDEGRIIYNLYPLDSKFNEIERKKFDEYYE